LINRTCYTSIILNECYAKEKLATLSNFIFALFSLNKNIVNEMAINVTDLVHKPTVTFMIGSLYRYIFLFECVFDFTFNGSLYMTSYTHTRTHALQGIEYNMPRTQEGRKISRFGDSSSPFAHRLIYRGIHTNPPLQ